MKDVENQSFIYNITLKKLTLNLRFEIINIAVFVSSDAKLFQSVNNPLFCFTAKNKKQEEKKKK